MRIKHSAKIFLTGIWIILGIVSCEEYSDKSLLSLNSDPEGIARNWVIATATTNGKDITSNFDKFTLDLTEKGDASLQAKFKLKTKRFEYKTIGKWFLINKQNKLLLDFENNDADVVYHILKIKDDAIWLKKEDEPLELHFITQ